MKIRNSYCCGFVVIVMVVIIVYIRDLDNVVFLVIICNFVIAMVLVVVLVVIDGLKVVN